MELRDVVIGGQRILDSQKEWGFDRSQFLNASEAEDCIRRIWYSKHQPELAEEQEWGFAWRGHLAEEYVVRCLKARNDVKLEYAGEEQESFQDDKLRLSATPDGIISFEDGPFEGLEIKSIDPRTNRNNLPRIGHVVQLKIGMALFNKRLAGQQTFRLKRGRILYIDASNYNDIIEFEVQADDTILDRYAAKAAKVFRTKSVDGLDREGKRLGTCTYCAFKTACGVDVAQPSSRKTPSSVSKAAKRYMEVRDSEEAIKLEKAALSEELKALLGSMNMNSTVVDGVEVKMTTVKGRESLDKKAVAKAGIDLSPFTTVGAPSVRLNVKRAT